jgi:glutaminase
MKKLLFLIALAFSTTANAQSFNEDITSFSNFIKRMYNAKPFEGVKIMDDYDHQYLVSIVSHDKTKYTSESTMHRVAQVKAQSQANTFLNGANISMEMMVNEMNNYDEKRVLYNMFKNLCDNGLTTREAEVAMGLSRRSYYRYKKIYG